LLHKSRENSQHPQIVEFLKSTHMFPENQPQHRNLWSAIWIVKQFLFCIFWKREIFLLFNFRARWQRTADRNKQTGNHGGSPWGDICYVNSLWQPSIPCAIDDGCQRFSPRGTSL